MHLRKRGQQVQRPLGLKEDQKEGKGDWSKVSERKDVGQEVGEVGLVDQDKGLEFIMGVIEATGGF